MEISLREPKAESWDSSYDGGGDDDGDDGAGDDGAGDE